LGSPVDSFDEGAELPPVGDEQPEHEHPTPKVKGDHPESKPRVLSGELSDELARRVGHQPT